MSLWRKIVNKKPTGCKIGEIEDGESISLEALKEFKRWIKKIN